MLEPNVNKRATMEDVLAHPWVRGEGMFSTTVASPY
jgi:hypothetical protein